MRRCRSPSPLWKRDLPICRWNRGSVYPAHAAGRDTRQGIKVGERSPRMAGMQRIKKERLSPLFFCFRAMPVVRHSHGTMPLAFCQSSCSGILDNCEKASIFRFLPFCPSYAELCAEMVSVAKKGVSSRCRGILAFAIMFCQMLGCSSVRRPK